MSSVKVACTASDARSSANWASTIRACTCSVIVGEPRLAGELDEDEPDPLGRLDHRVGQPVEAPPRLDHHARDADVGEPLDVRREPGVVVREQDTGGEQQLAPAQQPGDVGDLGGVRPPDLPVEMGAARAYGGLAVAHGRQQQHLGHGGVHAGQGVEGVHGAEASGARTPTASRSSGRGCPGLAGCSHERRRVGAAAREVPTG